MKKGLVASFFTLFTGIIFSQISPLNTTTNYYQQRNGIFPSLDTTDSDEGDAYVGFRRWASFWEPRLYGHGNFSIARTAMQNFALTIPNGCTNNASNLTWQEWGPTKNVGLHNGNGLIRGIAFDPDPSFPNTWYVASRYGGIFVTYDAGVNWQNFHTDNLPMTTSQDVQCEMDQSGNKYLFMTTGNGDMPAYAIYRYNITANSGWVDISSGLINHTSTDPWTIDELLVNPIDPNIIFAATDQGVYRTTNALSSSPTWSLVLPVAFPGIRGLEFKPCTTGCTSASYNTIYASGKDIFMSTNSGNSGTWNAITGSTGSEAFQGTTDEFVGFNVMKINLATTPANTNFLYANIIIEQCGTWGCSDSHVFGRFDVSAGTWELSSRPPCNPTCYGDATPDRMAFEASETNPDIVFYGNIYGHAYDFGSSQTVKNVTYLRCNNTNPSDLWDPGSIHDDKHFYIQRGNTLYIGCDGGIYTLQNPETNGCCTDKNGNGLGLFLATKLGVHPLDPNTVRFGAQDNASYVTGGPNNWLQQGNCCDGSEQIILPNGNYFSDIAYGASTRYYSPGQKDLGYPCGDYWEDWYKTLVYDYKPLPGSSDPGALYYTNASLAICLDPATSNSTIWCASDGLCHDPYQPCTSSSVMTEVGWAHIDRIKTYSQYNGTGNPLDGCQTTVKGVAVSGSSPCTIYLSYKFLGGSVAPCNISTAPMLFKTTTGGDLSPYSTCSQCSTGNCWTAIGSQTSLGITGNITSIVLDPSDDNRVWVASSGYANNGLTRKVVFSSDGGTTWSDFSQGLPDMNINCMIRQKGQDDRLFVGTDAGVYYRDNTMSQWECFGTALPNTIITDLDINDCGNKLYAASYGRGIWVCDMPVSNNTITSNTVYSGVVNSPGNIIVNPNVTLKITGTLYMPAGAKIIVKPKGILDVNTGTIDNNCGLQWGGIEVWGDPTKSQAIAFGKPVYQGMAKFGGANIRNCDFGVMAGSINAQGNIDFTKTGGIVQAFNSTFFRTINDAIFFNYMPSVDNVSYFKRCTFWAFPTTVNGSLPDARVLMQGVKGIKFWGNTFKTQGLSDYGIRSIDASYSVIDECLIPATNGTITICTGGITRNSFSGFRYCINATNATNFLPITVDHAIFSGFEIGGIYLGYGNYSTIKNCDFTMTGGYLGHNNIPKPDYGIYLDGTTGYDIRNNNFTAPSVGLHSGMYVTNSGQNPNLIYNNTFNNLKYGLWAQWANYNPGNYQGLMINCDDFNNCTFNVGVQGGIGTGIAQTQGNPLATSAIQTVRNTYVNTPSCTGENKYFVSKPSTYQFIHANQIPATTNPGPQPGCSNNTEVAIVTKSFPYSKSSDCPLNPTSSTSGTNLSQRILNANNTVNSLQSALNALIDGGNTQNLLSAINGTTSVGSLKNLLSSKSPYLSDEVLSAYFNKPTIPPGHIMEIHGLNAPVSDKIFSVISSLNLPEGVMNNIIKNQQKNPISGLMAKVGELQYAQSQLGLLVNEQIRVFLNDTVLVNPLDSVAKIIEQYNITDKSCQLISIAIAAHDYVKAQQLLDQEIVTEGQLDNFCKFQQLLLQLKQSIQKCYSIKTDQPLRDKIETIATSRIDGCVNAQAILKKVFRTRFEEEILFPDEVSARMAQSESTTAIVELTKDIRVYPNPAQNSLMIEIDRNNSIESGSILLSSVEGKQFKKVNLGPNKQVFDLDISDVPPGVYTIRIDDGNGLIVTRKIVIIK